MTHTPFKYSYFQLTFGQEEAYLHPERTYERLTRCGYDAIEICPPKGRYGLGVSMEDYLATHLRLKDDFGLESPTPALQDPDRAGHRNGYAIPGAGWVSHRTPFAT